MYLSSQHFPVECIQSNINYISNIYSSMVNVQSEGTTVFDVTTEGNNDSWPFLPPIHIPDDPNVLHHLTTDLTTLDITTKGQTEGDIITHPDITVSDEFEPVDIIPNFDDTSSEYSEDLNPQEEFPNFDDTDDSEYEHVPNNNDFPDFNDIDGSVDTVTTPTPILSTRIPQKDDDLG